MHRISKLINWSRMKIKFLVSSNDLSALRGSWWWWGKEGLKTRAPFYVKPLAPPIELTPIHSWQGYEFTIVALNVIWLTLNIELSEWVDTNSRFGSWGRSRSVVCLFTSLKRGNIWWIWKGIYDFSISEFPQFLRLLLRGLRRRWVYVVLYHANFSFRKRTRGRSLLVSSSVCVSWARHHQLKILAGSWRQYLQYMRHWLKYTKIPLFLSFKPRISLQKI